MSSMKMNLCCQFNNVAVLLLSLSFQQAKAKPAPSQDSQVKGTDCTEIMAANVFAQSGVYLIKPVNALQPFEVFCDKQKDGGWTVFQRRNGKGPDGTPVNFRRLWKDYQKGFGDVGYEHWLGLDFIHALSQQPGKTCILRLDLMNCKGERASAIYDTFKIGDKRELYRIHLGSYDGNAGDAFRGSGDVGSQDRCSFSTSDQDNDGCDFCIKGGQAFRSCARDRYGGGWWFSNCGMANLNGDWHPEAQCEGWLSGVYWQTWEDVNSLAFSELKVKCTLL